jgi:uncharacterized protein
MFDFALARTQANVRTTSRHTRENPLITLRSAGSYLTDLLTPTVRLGVTGLARAGKTVFITALVRNLLAGGRLPFFLPHAEGRILRAYLEPQPDDDVPRFAYEDHLEALARDPPDWPESTRRISELRVTVEYLPRSTLRRQLGTARLHVDIVDYPGEWLIDLPMLGESYAEWSRKVLAEARDPRRAASAADILALLAAADPAAPQDETLAKRGAQTFTTYLRRVRASDGGPAIEGPGRFLMPGDLEGSPLLTFMPLDLTEGWTSGRGSLGQMMERRYEAYKSRVVRPFFRDHFARLDRQIVLVDALAAIDKGAGATADLEAALSGILASFKPGASPWLAALAPRRIDRILFAATKADHLHHSSHDRLEAILGGLTAKAAARARFAGAEVKSLALSALRSTREAEVKRGGERLACIVGTPLPGERIEGTAFDGRRSTAIFPGDLPHSAEAVLAGATGEGRTSDVRFLRFRPARIPPDSLTGERAPWPHVRLDRALDFLIGDYLA